MTTPAPTRRTTQQILIDLLMLNVGKISAVIEQQGHRIFGQANLLSKEEINDYSLEFLELVVMLLQSGKHMDRRSAEFSALRKFFTTFSQQIQMRGSNLDEFVRYIQFLQRVFLDNLEADATVDFDQSREILLLLGSIFNDLILDVLHVYLEEKERTIQAKQ
ncbi:MAG: STAS domain-containing protein, partial [Acidiferrobacterales bacterium]